MDVILSVSAGHGELHYQWRFNDANLAGKTNQFLRLTGVNTAMEGTYSVVVSDANGPLVDDLTGGQRRRRRSLATRSVRPSSKPREKRAAVALASSRICRCC
jgi:hypothetical protein